MDGNLRRRLKEDIISFVYKGGLKNDLKNELRYKLLKFYLNDSSGTKRNSVEIQEDELTLVMDFLEFNCLNYTKDILISEIKDFAVKEKKFQLKTNERLSMRLVIDNFFKSIEKTIVEKSQQTESVSNQDNYAVLRLEYEEKFEKLKSQLIERHKEELKEKLEAFESAERSSIKLEVLEKEREKFDEKQKHYEEMNYLRERELLKRESTELNTINDARYKENSRAFIERQQLQIEIESIKTMKKDFEIEKKEFESYKTNQNMLILQKESLIRQKEEDLKMKYQSFENELNNRIEQLKRSSELELAKERTYLEVLRVSLEEEKKIFTQQKLEIMKMRSDLQEKSSKISQMEFLSYEDLKANYASSEENLSALKTNYENLNKKIIEKDQKIEQLETEIHKIKIYKENYENLQDNFKRIQRDFHEKELGLRNENRNLSVENDSLISSVENLKGELKTNHEKLLRMTMQRMEERKKKFERPQPVNVKNNTKITFQKNKDDNIDVIEREYEKIQLSFKNWEMKIKEKLFDFNNSNDFSYFYSNLSTESSDSYFPDKILVEDIKSLPLNEDHQEKLEKNSKDKIQSDTLPSNTDTEHSIQSD